MPSLFWGNRRTPGWTILAEPSATTEVIAKVAINGVIGKVPPSRHGHRRRQLPRVAVSPAPDRCYLFRFSFTRNFTILVTSVSGSGLSFGNCTAPLDHLYGPNCFLKAAIPDDIG